MEINKLYNTDCLCIMNEIPDESVDLVIADPPYFKIVNEDWDNQWKTINEYVQWCSAWIYETKRILKETGSFYFWSAVGKHDEHPIFELIKVSEKAGMIFRDWITWKKKRGYGNKKGYMFAREELIFFTKTKEYTFNSSYTEEKSNSHGIKTQYKTEYKRCGNVWDDINEVNVGNLMFTERVKHPTQKPLKACHRIISASSNKHDLIYIPFAGSGSEIVACIETERNWIATETNVNYCNIIRQRIS